jgi:hypothetical protein
MVLLKVLGKLYECVPLIKIQLSNDLFDFSPIALGKPLTRWRNELDNRSERRGCENVVLRLHPFHLGRHE